MMKIFLWIAVLLLFAVSASAISSEEIRECKAECRVIQQNETISCSQEFNSCRESCTNASCRRECSLQKMQCSRNVSMDYRACQKECMPKRNVPSTCKVGNETYNIGDKFTNGCNVCSCNGITLNRAQVSCTRDSFCNKNVSITEEACTSSNGFYHQLCKGPYFSIVCTPDKYCLCEGKGNYSCPENYECMKNFVAPLTRKGSISGWRDLLGKDLGNIGVCSK